MRCAWHLEGSGEEYTGFLWGNLKERDHLGDPGVDGMIIFRWVLRKCVMVVWTGSIWFSVRTGGGHL
jgi:hypothetical protein